MEQFTLSQKQIETIIKYIKDRRYKMMISMYLCMILVVIGIPAMLADIQLLSGNGSRTLASAAVPLGQLARRYYGHRYVPGEFLFIWIGFVIVLIILIVRNYGIRFGKNSDLDCMQRGMYTVETASFAGKSEDTGKHPYYLFDADGKPYKCPVFLEWKKADWGTKILFVSLSNGRGYAMLPESTEPDKEWWEEDPF